jgi:hypothetical protein
MHGFAILACSRLVEPLDLFGRRDPSVKDSFVRERSGGEGGGLRDVRCEM